MMQVIRENLENRKQRYLDELTLRLERIARNCKMEILNIENGRLPNSPHDEIVDILCLRIATIDSVLDEINRLGVVKEAVIY